MFELQDALNIEGEAEDSEAYYVSMQKAINEGLWSLPGRNGRAMMEAIESGHCVLGRRGCRDYYGNYIPSRREVKSGTKGSKLFVTKHNGREWSDMMVEV